MRRRHFLSLTGQIAATAYLRPLLALQPSRVREAVVIGVDQAGHLPKLRGAASGATAFNTWLTGEGFRTSLLTDATKSVTANDVYTAISTRVRAGTVDQLVVYFAGHGYISSYSEFWMLSDAPENPNEAVSLRESIELAKMCGIPNVVFVSDACRSRADSLGTEGVRGSLIFPNRTGPSMRVGDVDVFLATLVGDPSFEVPVSTSATGYQGIYTQAFLDAFKTPDPPMVRTIDGVAVVPNRRMKGFLEREVSRRAAAVSIQIRQVPDTQVVSDDDTYIGHVVSTPASTPTAAVATVHDVAAVELSTLGVRGISRPSDQLPGPGAGRGGPLRVTPSPQAVQAVKMQSGYAAAATQVKQSLAFRGRSSGGSSPERGVGVVVRGARVLQAVAQPPFHMGDLNVTGDTTLIPCRGWVSGAPRATTAALQFEDKQGTVTAVLRDYWTVITVDHGAVMDVSYVPSPSSSFGSPSPSQQAQLDDLHASIAAAARSGVFRIEGSKASRQATATTLADRIRVLKGVDPTLGLYAAYAYSDAGVPAQVSSVRSIMRSTLDVDVFDVAMLANALNGKTVGTVAEVVPFCPMLAQGWNYLRIKEIRLAPSVEKMRDFLRDGLWTTLNPRGVEVALGAIRS